jgi:hypothetical protein
MKPPQKIRKDLTPVDDVRRVREELHRECGGDVRKLAARANKTAEQYRRKLGLKFVQAPAKDSRHDGTRG